MPKANAVLTTPRPALAAAASSRRRLFAGLSATLLAGAAIVPTARAAPAAVPAEAVDPVVAIYRTYSAAYAAQNAACDAASEIRAQLIERWGDIPRGSTADDQWG